MTASSAHFPHSDTATAELAGVSLAYPKGEAVLKALDWTLQPGQVVGLLGRNGCGKTTLLETLLGLREPQQGRVQLFGQDAARLDDAARARIGYVPQQSDLFESFTAAQLLAYFKSFYPRWNESRVEGLLSRWDIARDKPIRKLSGGQQQRLSIIRALAHDPDLLVLDEPVASLDPVGRRDFLRELVDQVLDRGTTVVFSTHILSDLERVAFNLAFLSGGRIALQAPLDELLEQVRAFTGTVTELASLFARLNAQPLKRTPLEAGRERVLARLPAGVSAPLDAQAVNLEDLFAELT
ncbi:MULTISPECIES: ABC transporter ATP-binding protein [unclassified Roseateles]|uniref:ABC transporter ATP-binding protein n=1 Tax=Pelomonas sp. Root1237 TaxID=1736434 RepID=UPI0006FF5865|nr:ABC transporter ATP-binding protein [Pelomonas sp. Root1237]KQV96368.1 ABC transporter ATP-binding protein [Pelomonas sp. Root1237]